MPDSRGRPAERMLWVAGYVMVVLAPLALLAVAVKPGAQGSAVVFAAGLGFAGLSLLVLQVIASGRWGAITAAFGLRSVLALHRQAGILALVLVIGHVVALMVDDPGRLALLDPRDAPLRARAGMAAVIAMLALAGTSVWRRRLRLSYEAWRAVHVVGAAVVIGGSFVHLAGVSAYLSLPAIRWGVLLLVLVGVVGLFSVRVARPYALARRPFRVASVRRERGDAVTVELEADGHRGTRFAPGQFAWLKLAGRPYAMDEHPFSGLTARGPATRARCGGASCSRRASASRRR
jgi:predicted ferric reductase